jgi:hypothetical protein
MRTLWVILFLLLYTPLFAQSPSSSFLVAWWDVEALFDTKPDTTTDVDFTPSGKYQWTPEKLDLKFKRLAQTIQGLARSRGFALPDIMGFCNIEHQWLLDTLFQKYLRTNDFQTVFFASPSSASRNLGLVFNRRKFSLNFSSVYPIMLDTGKFSMPDIMLVKLDYRGRLLNIVLNHWLEPKPLNPLVESARLRAAQLLRSILASLREGEKDPNILVFGNFNTAASNRAFNESIRASDDSSYVRLNAPDFMLNLSLVSPNSGTVRMRAKWYAYDQALVSASMLDEKNFYVFANSLERFSAPYLFQPSRRSDPVGQLFSTFYNERYIGGYSHHLPISVVVYFR